jgi:hypothetical protein
MTTEEERPVKIGTDTQATSPRGVIERFERYLGDRDVEALVGLYEPDAAFEAEPGTVVHGHGAIRQALARFLALEPTITGEIQKVVEADGTALVVNKMAARGDRPGRRTDPDGRPERRRDAAPAGRKLAGADRRPLGRRSLTARVRRSADARPAHRASALEPTMRREQLGDVLVRQRLHDASLAAVEPLALQSAFRTASSLVSRSCRETVAR